MPESLISVLASFGVALPEEVVDREVGFIEELLRWNQRINLTSINNRDEAIEKHLVDSLVLLPYLSATTTLLDMGSGGGLPGVPLAIAKPDLRVVSVDSVGKKINFQKHVKRKFALENLTPLNCRLEQLAENLPAAIKIDTVVARAFAAFDRVLLFADEHLEAAGRVLVMKGPEGVEEWDKLLDKNSFSLCRRIDYGLPWSGAERQLYILEKSPR